MIHTLIIDPDFRSLLPNYKMSMIEAEVVNGPYNFELQREIDQTKGMIATNCRIDEIKEIPAIKYTREAYKKLGKDPNRYRPAAEQLRRRILKGIGLYTINALVDMGNLVSLETGFSIGVFDAEKVSNQILIRRGKKEDLFEGIGRGILNVEGLPLYVDEIGPFATPTSDSERSKVLTQTKKTLIFINNFIPQDNEAIRTMSEAEERTFFLLRHFLSAKNVEITRYQ